MSADISFINNKNFIESKVDCLVNVVTCEGIIEGKVGCELKKLYPHMFQDYKAKYIKGEIKNCKPYVYETRHHEKHCRNIKIINIPIEKHCTITSKLECIEDNIIYLCSKLEDWNIDSIAFPPMYYEISHSNWKYVKSMIIKYFKKLNLNIKVEIYEPLFDNATRYYECLEIFNKIKKNKI